jgi:excisionase family DNA binding protein
MAGTRSKMQDDIGLKVRSSLPRLYTYEEIAVALGVSKKQVERYVADGMLNAVILSPRKRRITREAFTEFVRKMSTTKR